MGKTFKDKRKKHQVEVIEQFLGKLAALRIISKVLTKFSHTAYFILIRFILQGIYSM